MSERTAYLLVFHGSRNRHYPEKLSRLGILFRQEVDSLVETAVLELTDIPLAEKIVQFYQKAIALGYQKIAVLPVFLSEGIHVREDIPQELAQARSILKSSQGAKINLKLLDCLSSASNLTELLEQRFNLATSEARILLAHGSRIPESNRQIEAIAHQLGAAVAFWKTAPDLDSVVQSLVEQNKKSIAIVPYFLFLGTITDAIASRVIQLQLQYPKVKICLTQPLGATPELATVLASIALKEPATLS